MKRIGTVSYNIYGNFTNYGSALQTWALHEAIRRCTDGDVTPVLVDYCPDMLRKADPLHPFANMWDQDADIRRMCRESLPAIRENYRKFSLFFREKFIRTERAYTSENFDSILEDEKIDGFLCGSDTIFCLEEFGIDNGYFANYRCMRGRSAAYAASFGDSIFSGSEERTLNARLRNFTAIGLRESRMISYVKERVAVPVRRVLDPTLLLTAGDYAPLEAKRLERGPYLLLYARRYDAEMEAYAEKLAERYGWKIAEISLRSDNAEKPNRRMWYQAGVEEFLSLVRYAECVVTNSFHAVIFSVQYQKSFYVFSRPLCDGKIIELLELLGLSERLCRGAQRRTETRAASGEIDYRRVYERLRPAREESAAFLQEELYDYL